jgi:CubicO group peptidase (beta-lactamase class C family)
MDGGSWGRFSRRRFLAGGATAAAGLAGARPVRAGGRPVALAPPPALVGVRSFIVEKIESGIVPSLVVLIASRGVPIWAEAFGYADLESRRPATLDSIYKIASISKPFTVSALMTLADRGRVDFDAPANQYLRGARLRARRGSAEAMTLRRLANHTSGLPIHEILFYDGARRLTPVETISRYGFAAWRPGSRFEYSNLGTAILGFVSSDVAGMPWSDFMQDALLDPLGLRSTFAELPPGRERPLAGARREHLTVQYDYDISGRFVRTGPHLTSHPGASSMWSNAADLARFAEMHLQAGRHSGRRILSPHAVATMQDFTVPTREPGVVYGNGWVTHANLVRRNFNHSGGGPGVGVALAAFPDEQVVTVVLTNYFGAMAVETSRRIAEAMFGAAGPPPAPSMPPTPVRPAVTGRWRGLLHHHDGNIPLALSVSPGEAAELRFGRTPPVALSQVAASRGEFRGTAVGILMRGPGYHGDSILDFVLEEADGRLAGIVDVYAKGYFEVAHWVELERSE